MGCANGRTDLAAVSDQCTARSLHVMSLLPESSLVPSRVPAMDFCLAAMQPGTVFSSTSVEYMEALASKQRFQCSNNAYFKGMHRYEDGIIDSLSKIQISAIRRPRTRRHALMWFVWLFSDDGSARLCHVDTVCRTSFFRQSVLVFV